MSIETGHVEFEYQPNLKLPALCEVEVQVHMPDGRACVTVRDAITKYVIESRPECQVIEAGERHIVVALPGTIKTRKLPWKVRLLRWLAKG